ncbi:MAG: MBL fold metallo-hydrolase [Chloroflexi bacterium]|nr:MBL fold metallo-hydrolase [Chloroflexota bacterium]
MRLAIGATEVHRVRDGTDRVPPDMILAGAPPDELATAVIGHADAEGMLPVAYDSLLIHSGGRVVLVDAGLGELSESEGAGGKLASGLASLGIAPEDVDVVVISHGHADHIGGLIRTSGDVRVPVYGRATHWFWRDEWTFWTSETVLASMPVDLAEPARACLPPLADADLVELADAEQEVAPGIVVIPAPGHTPGHVAVVIESNGERATYLGDSVFHPLNVAYPDWACVFDVDRVAAAASRGWLLDRAARDGSLVLAAHLGSPGRVQPRGHGYRFVPEAGAMD